MNDGPASPSHSKQKSASKPAPQAAQPKLPAPDKMLAPHWDYIKALGKGGSGDTGLFRPTNGGEDVAIKLIKRPLPKVAMPNILREITVSASCARFIVARSITLRWHSEIFCAYGIAGSLPYSVRAYRS